jgi:hypothetical protein
MERSAATPHDTAKRERRTGSRIVLRVIIPARRDKPVHRLQQRVDAVDVAPPLVLLRQGPASVSRGESKLRAAMEATRRMVAEEARCRRNGPATTGHVGRAIMALKAA